MPLPTPTPHPTSKVTSKGPQKGGLSFGCEFGRAAGHLSKGLRLMCTEFPENIIEGKMSLANCGSQPESCFPGLRQGLSGASATPACLLDLSLCEFRGFHKCLEPLLGHRNVFVTRIWAQAGRQHASDCCLERPILCADLEPGPAWALGDQAWGEGEGQPNAPHPQCGWQDRGSREPVMH